MRLTQRAVRTFIASGFCLVVGLPAAVFAKTVKLPEDAPQVMFDVPDDWTVTPTPLGLDVAPADKSALIVAGLTPRDRNALTKWQKEATARMVAFGVAFDPKATRPKTSSKSTPKAEAPTLFSGAPSIGTPEQGPQAPTAFEDKEHAGLPLEALTGRPAPKGAKIPFNGLVIYGASYAGSPVDTEFLNFSLSPKELLLMQQESGKTDDRIAAIIGTVRRP